MTLKLPSRLHPSLLELKSQIQKTAESELEQWISQHNYIALQSTKIQVDVTKQPKPVQKVKASTIHLSDEEETPEDQLGPGLANVSQFLAVYSCKGGVGKSTVAVNLAYELARQGGKIGLLDVDIYGPSLPILVKPEDPVVRQSPLGAGMVYPISHKGVKLLSLGFVSSKSGVPGSGPESGSAIMRGPMVGRVVTQLLKGTDWGDLDVLVLDLPPGTGDVQLTVCQDIQLDGAVAVTTPSKLATEDTRKGIHMFSSLGVSTMALVENMSYFVCDGGGKHYPFGKGQQEALLQDKSINPANIVSLPISSLANDATEQGEPIALTRPERATEELDALQKLATIISKELLLAQFTQPDSFVRLDGVDFPLDTMACSIGKDGAEFVVRLYSDAGATKIQLPAFQLRARDPKTGEIMPGESLEQPERSPKTLPSTVEKKGHYGFTVEWADRATLIYSLQAVAKAAQGAAQGKI
ncbi:Iron-sulfur cluster carrier protein [Seminavis robusta]|uniref:Iron-sulfur cluster carrier protein n=1 Tax=Seminavis robusta TaxID=568900 RepID=A0A9N8DAA3_9STRA|nr:Iron-sulfur cluster carrier protein [Seminavis robusta]|eukprot:Sro55_g032350.1 Iron-sulfur cluster carrier protein (468) ;mRNA; r:81492-83282